MPPQNSAAPNIPALSIRGVRKSYGGPWVLDGVDLDIAPGEIHALLGENGAGKTTLMNILYGLSRPDAGTLKIHGARVDIASPHAAAALGVGMVHQHFMLVQNLTVAENLFLGEGLPSGKAGEAKAGGARRRFWFSRSDAFAAAAASAESFRMRIDPRRRIEELSVGEQQRVELLKALRRGARILILDEPTAVLAPQEARELFDTMEHLRSLGHSIVFISHKLKEVASVCDRVSVLRGGRIVATRAAAEASAGELGELMVGSQASHSSISQLQESSAARASSAPGLRLEKIAARSNRLGPIDLSIAPGEIFAIAGVEGNGQRELARLIEGIEKPSAGRIHLGPIDATRLNPAQRALAGLAAVSGDRAREGLALPFAIADNLLLKTFSRAPFSRAGWMRARPRREFARACLAKYDIRAASIHAPAASLSGGNQQKVVIAREFENMRTALLAVNPTRGLDVGSTAAVHARLREARSAGIAILVITTELDEAMLLADRFGVMFKGRLTTAPGPPFDRAEIGRIMLGEEQTITADGRMD